MLTTRDPGPKPSKEPGCKCGDYTLVNGHWTQVYNPRCPVHGMGDEDYPGRGR